MSMHDLLSFFIGGYVRYALVALVTGLLAIVAILLFTRDDYRVRKWLIAKDHRIESLGVVLLVLIWLGFFLYNRATGK